MYFLLRFTCLKDSPGHGIGQQIGVSQDRACLGRQAERPGRTPRTLEELPVWCQLNTGTWASNSESVHDAPVSKHHRSARTDVNMTISGFRV